MKGGENTVKNLLYKLVFLLFCLSIAAFQNHMQKCFFKVVNQDYWSMFYKKKLFFSILKFHIKTSSFMWVYWMIVDIKNTKSVFPAEETILKICLTMFHFHLTSMKAYFRNRIKKMDFLSHNSDFFFNC